MINKNQKSNSTALLNEKEVADYLGVTTRCLQKMRATGTGPKFLKLSRKIVRYRWSDVQTWIDCKTVSSTTDANFIENAISQ